MKIIKILAIFLSICTFSFTYLSNVKAQPTFTFDEYNVEITVNEDTTFTVKETIKNIVDGEFHGLRRDIPLDNPNCTADSTFTCGGFDLIVPIGIYDEDGNVPEDGISYYIVEDEFSPRSFRFEWEIYADGKDVDNEEYTWTVEYLIIGGIQWIGETEEDSYPYFYWNTLAEDRAGETKDSEIVINFPEDINLDETYLYEYTSLFDYETDVDRREARVEYNLKNLPTYGHFTVAYMFDQEDLIKPGTVNYEITRPEFSNEVYWNDLLLTELNKDTFKNFPAGDHEFEFKRFGYKSETREFEVDSDEEVNIKVELEPTAFMSFLILLSKIATVLGLIGIPYGIYWAYRKYKSKGKDIGMPGTIIPEYTYPDGVRPYLLGSIKDEKVDREDITGSIIDLAYRGYLKIKEIKKNKDYELIKQEFDKSKAKKGETGLNPVEEKLMNALFKDGDTVKTSSLTYKFVQDLEKIKNDVYDEMVSLGYFKKSPKSVREQSYGIAVLSIIVGVILTIFASIAISGILGIVQLFTPGVALVVMGFCYFFLAPHMPAKTDVGSKVFSKILGFKMYMQTAERYRVQNLTPETFEKFLPYAIVFKIEKEWAEKFKDIYKQVPDWYEGDGSFTDAVFYSSFARNFSDATTAKISSVAGASKGGGWSGSGGSFGGFSGGGGGGGSAGGW